MPKTSKNKLRRQVEQLTKERDEYKEYFKECFMQYQKTCAAYNELKKEKSNQKADERRKEMENAPQV
jgi:hypothetical protein